MGPTRSMSYFLLRKQGRYSRNLHHTVEYKAHKTGSNHAWNVGGLFFKAWIDQRLNNSHVTEAAVRLSSTVSSEAARNLGNIQERKFFHRGFAEDVSFKGSGSRPTEKQAEMKERKQWLNMAGTMFCIIRDDRESSWT